MDIGSRILQLRKAHGLTQTELGQRVGVKRAAIQKYESGLVENIPLKSIETLADALGVTPSYLMGWQQREATLADEVLVLQKVQETFGKDSVEALEQFYELNEAGKKRVLLYINDLVSVPHYRSEED